MFPIIISHFLPTAAEPADLVPYLERRPHMPIFCLRLHTEPTSGTIKTHRHRFINLPVYRTMLTQAIHMLTAGMETPLGILTATTTPGRFPEEQRLTVHLTADDATANLLTITVYHGWKWYTPWAELTTIAASIHLGTRRITYHDSPIETQIISLFADAIQPPAHIFISYQTDRETAQGLAHGVPAPATWLGYMLFARGFTWYKDWYYPEGWQEGHQKLQAEKPLNQQHRQRHHRNIVQETAAFLAADDTDTDITIAGRQRAHRILDLLHKRAEK